MKSCFGYVRVSTIKQGDGVSLQAQKDAIMAFASRNNINITKWFEEKETAAKKGRPIFNAMVSELKRGKARGVVIHKIDRFARNYTDWGKISDLADSGVEILTATESYDFNTYGGRMAADFQQVVAANYIRNLRDEIKKGQNGQLKNGLYPFGAPIGYLNAGGGKPKVPDPERGPLVRLAFELYSTGQYSYRPLLKELKRRGLRNKSGKSLSLCGLETLIKNPFYCGIIHIKRTGQTFNGIHEPLISVALFQRVQDVRTSRTSKQITRHNHTYRGLFRCGECGGAMVPELQKGHVYYRCKLMGCPTKTVREEVLEAEVTRCLEHIKLTKSDVALAARQIRKWMGEKRQTISDSAAQLRLANIRDRIDSLTDALIDKLIDKETFNLKKAKLALEEAQALEDQQRTVTLQQKADNLRTLAELVISLAQTYVFGKTDEKRHLVEMATSNRRVSGKNVYLEPASWVLEVQNAIAVLCCAEAPDKSRTFGDLNMLFEESELPTREQLCENNIASTTPEKLGRSHLRE
tara:strand:- start:31887 stop:33452 length:1566 start_codon:yes stop_codon:yes gene_type:complete